MLVCYSAVCWCCSCIYILLFYASVIQFLLCKIHAINSLYRIELQLCSFLWILLFPVPVWYDLTSCFWITSGIEIGMCKVTTVSDMDTASTIPGRWWKHGLKKKWGISWGETDMSFVISGTLFFFMTNTILKYFHVCKLFNCCQTFCFYMCVRQYIVLVIHRRLLPLVSTLLGK